MKAVAGWQLNLKEIARLTVASSEMYSAHCIESAVQPQSTNQPSIPGMTS